MKKTIKVIAALIMNNEKKILLAKRGSSSDMIGLWEFPGGKVEVGETDEECLKRELFEELGITCEVGKLFAQNAYDYGEKIVKLFVYDTFIVKGIPQNIVHQSIRWVDIHEMIDMEMPEADRPIVEKIIKASKL